MAASLLNEQLRRPLQHCLLPHLTSRELAIFSCASKGLQQLVSEAPIASWYKSAQASLAAIPPQLWKATASGEPSLKSLKEIVNRWKVSKENAAAGKVTSVQQRPRLTRFSFSPSGRCVRGGGWGEQCVWSSSCL